MILSSTIHDPNLIIVRNMSPTAGVADISILQVDHHGPVNHLDIIYSLIFKSRYVKSHT